MIPGNQALFAWPAFILRNTLSEHGGVTRGIRHVGQDGYLQRVIETRNVVKQPHGAAVQEPDGSLRPLDPDCFVSMNMWGMTPEFLQELDKGFRDFFRRGEEELDKTEFLIPIFVDQLLQEGRFPCGSFPRRTGGSASPIGGGQAPGGRGLPGPHCGRRVRR